MNGVMSEFCLGTYYGESCIVERKLLMQFGWHEFLQVELNSFSWAQVEK